jgi:hypothetical protein
LHLACIEMCGCQTQQALAPAVDKPIDDTHAHWTGSRRL